jgi:polar amino acid transport system substrate-binding protein
MLNRRILMGAAGALAFIHKARAADPLEIFSADVRPLSIAEGPRRGVVLDIVSEAFKAIGRDVRFTFLPFAEALQRTQSQPGALVTPLARSPQREASFAWIAKVIDVPQAMGTLAGRPAADLDTARKFARVGVVRAGVQESFLRDSGFTNLVLFATAAEIAKALAAGEIDAWYATSTEIALQIEATGRLKDLHIGPTLQVAPAWLAGNKDMASVPVAQIAKAMADLERSGTVQRIYRTYVSG